MHLLLWSYEEQRTEQALWPTLYTGLSLWAQRRGSEQRLLVQVPIRGGGWHHPHPQIPKVSQQACDGSEGPADSLSLFSVPFLSGVSPSGWCHSPSNVASFTHLLPHLHQWLAAGCCKL